MDLTLEQTVNADAASRMTGISAFTQNVNARSRWMITHSLRSAILGYLFTLAGLRKSEDSTQELTHHRIVRDNSDVQKIISGIEETLNPFNEAAQDGNLYCLSTGKATTEEVKSELLHCTEMGKRHRDAFTEECLTNPGRFEKPIKRCKVKNFSADAIKVKLTVKDKKIKELQGTRDLFGRLLYLAVTNDVDLAVVFSYPLTPVPLTLAHVDGSMNKTNKSKLMHKLEEKVETSQPSSYDACAVDAMFLVRSLVNVPATFGEIAMVLLTRLLAFAKRVDFVCDSYNSPTIKDSEHDLRGSDSTNAEYVISGPDQKRPKDFNSALKSAKFKTALLNFCVKEWHRIPYVEQIRDHTLFVGFGDKAYQYEVKNEEIKWEEVPSLACKHEEADTRLLWHVKHMCDTATYKNIIVRSSDTDVLVILLTHDHILSSHLWLEVGVSHNNTQRYIDVSKLAQVLGPELCSALPGLHAFTGCDYTASFTRKGKVHPLALLEKEPRFRIAFANLGESPHISPSHLEDIEAFVCSMYGKPNMGSVNKARHHLFQQHFRPKRRSLPLDKIKGSDPSHLPPCQSVLLQKIKLTNHIAYVWRNALTPEPHTWLPEENGWVLKNGHYRILWFEGRQVPENVSNIIEDTDIVVDEEEIEAQYCSSSDESESDSDLQ